MVNARSASECKQVCMLTSSDVVCLTMMPGCRIGTEGAKALAPSVQRLGQLVQLHLDGEYYTVLVDAGLGGVVVSTMMEVRSRFWSACLSCWE